ncbi:MAG TPA: GNAT family N-acetyltransferase [Candidatus Binatia bacterium]|nr:GNAT family N-acetyltransferase [Candidatus Binatia bacterium]
MPEDTEIRELRDIDVQEVYEVALESWQHTYADIYPSYFIQDYVNKNYAQALLLRLLPLIQTGQHFFHVALAHSRVVGFCHIAQTKQGMELFRIYLRPAYIGKGIGRTLLREGEEFIKSRGYHSYFCFVHKNNELGKSFYLRNGFTHLVENDQEDEWHMEKGLADV